MKGKDDSVAEFTIERQAGAFRWRLLDGPSREIARSGQVFGSYEEARDAIDDVKRAVGAADLMTPPPDTDAVVDAASEQSFPASDPPSSWAGGSGD